MSVDTSSEAVAEAVRIMSSVRLHGFDKTCHAIADLISALAQERDAARRLNAEYEDHIGAQDAQLATARLDRDKAEAERDAVWAEVERIKAAWLFVIQAENSCAASGAPCRGGGKCGCAAELKMLLREHDERAALAAKENGQ